MAANYSATIQLIVEGQQRLDRLQNQVTALNKQIKELARLDIGGVFEDPLMGGAVAKLRAARNEQVASLKQTGQQQDLVNRKLESQLLNQIRLNSAVDLYKRRINEVSRTAAPEQVQFRGRLQELEQAFQFFKGKGSVQGVQAVATELGRIVEYSREVTRLELGRVKSSQQIKDYTAQIEKLRAAGLNTTKAETTLEKFAVNAGTNKFKLAEKYKIVLDSRLKSLTEELRLQKEIAAAEARRGREAGGRAGNAISSAIIGGGFPLLFGQGPAAAAGGALGGLAGGLVGGGFGFALSIAGTALGDAAEKADTFNKQLAMLNTQVTGTGNSIKLTSADVNNLAKSLGIANDEAIKVLQTFAGFGDTAVTKSLAFLYGDDASVFKGLAAVKDQADLAQVILGTYERIGIERATQLINQLKLGDSASVELAFQKALLDAKIKQTEEGLKQIKIQDRIVAFLQTAANFTVGGNQQVVDPAIYGQQRVNEFRNKNQPSTIFTNALRGLRQLREATRGVEALRPDKGEEKAAREAARLAEQKQKQLEAAARLVVTTDTQLKKAAALTKEEQLIADIDQQRMERMTKYETMYRQALSNAEIEYLVAAQSNEIMAEKLNYEKALLDMALEQSSMLTQRDPLADLQQEVNLLSAKLQGKEEEYLRQQEIDALVSQGVQLEDAIAQIDARTQLNNLLQQQVALEQLVANIGQGMGNALTGVFDALIARADSFNEVLSNTLASLGRFLMMAGLNALADMGDPSGRGVGILSFLGFGKGFGKRAGGGPVQAGTPFVVGERGPELFVPGTNGGVMSNSDLRASMGSGMGGSAGAPVLNMSFETTSIGGVEYVSRDQLEAAMAATRRQAARDGAQRGMTMTLDKLQQSPRTRSRVGLG